MTFRAFELLSLGPLWAGFAINTLAGFALAWLADRTFTREARILVGGLAITCSLIAVRILLRCVDIMLS